MKVTTLMLIAGTVVIIASCSPSKKSAGTTSTSTPAPTTTPTSSDNPFRFVKPDGIHEPGSEELAAIQVQYKSVTLEKLKEGHTQYTAGACINCHEAKSIYDHEETEWKDIIDNMAQRAELTDAQKDAVYKYVLAIKATQPK